MGFLANLFKSKKAEQIESFKSRGAVIIDVRTAGEFRNGHIEGSKNYALDNLRSQVKSIKAMEKPIIVCCASGMRSAQAKSILEKEGIEVINGGGWRSLK
jgi:phage shock protein E